MRSSPPVPRGVRRKGFEKTPQPTSQKRRRKRKENGGGSLRPADKSRKKEREKKKEGISIPTCHILSSDGTRKEEKNREGNSLGGRGGGEKFGRKREEGGKGPVPQPFVLRPVRARRGKKNGARKKRKKEKEALVENQFAIL